MTAAGRGNNGAAHVEERLVEAERLTPAAMRVNTAITPAEISREGEVGRQDHARGRLLACDIGIAERMPKSGPARRNVTARAVAADGDAAG